MKEKVDVASTTRRRLGRWLLRVSMGAGVLIWFRALLASPAPLVPGSALLGPQYRLSGAVHLHTSLSDGRGSPAQVIEAARRARADFVVITDHNRVDPSILDALAGRPDDPVVILGAEVSTEAGHVLAVGIRPPGFRFSGTLREVLDDIRHLGGCAFIAHPTSPRGEMRFAQEAQQGSWGVEIANGDSAWREASPMMLALATWMYPVGPDFALRNTLGTFASERSLWDRVLSRRFAAAVGGTDAHGRIPVTRNVSIPIPSYQALVNLVRTVVQLDAPLPRSPTAARAAISRALCAGSSVISIPSLADARGFSFVVETVGGAVLGPGATLRFMPGSRLRVGGPMPSGTLVRLVESGRPSAVAPGSLDFEVTRPGVYRVEAYLPGEDTPWVLSNPISILTADLELSRARAAMPESEAYVEGTTVIDRFESRSGFAAEHDPGSGVEEPIIDPAGGRGHGGAAVLSFRLNDTPAPPVWCALVDRTRRDLSANRGISFWLKADGEYRVWFQVRDQNSASPDEGAEAWFSSIRTSPAWTLYNVPFASLRSINRASDGSLDPHKVTGLVFVIDHGAMPFGSKGKIWIDDLMAY